MTKSFKEQIKETQNQWRKNYHRLIEMPLVIPQIPFSHDDPEKNKTYLHELLNEVTTCFKNFDTHAVYMAGTRDAGIIFVHNKMRDTMDYYMNFVADKEFFGEGVKVQEIWADPISPYTKSVTQDSIFSFLLKIHKCFISDQAYTPEGKIWWINLMKKASANIGMFSVYVFSSQHKAIDRYNRKEPIEIWIKDNEDVWGEDAGATDIRFVIVHGVLE